MISRAALALSLALFAPAVLGCGGSEEPSRTEPAEQSTQTETTEPTATQTAQAQTEYPAEIQKNFIDACQANGGSASQCSCALDEVQKQFTLDEFLKEDAASRANGGAPSQRVTEAVAECR